MSAAKVVVAALVATLLLVPTSLFATATEHLDAASVPDVPVDASAAITLDAVSALMPVAASAWPAHDFATVTFALADLDGVALARTTDATITIDPTAAGWGWHTDAVTPPPAAVMDLLTVLAHELGHVIGHAHAEGDTLMAATL
ncbi:MAG: hypothetical protein ABWZ15_18650, partial [Acidimicrobiia bacterium]